MAKDTQDRTETLREHGETIERARAALYGGGVGEKDFWRLESAFDAIRALAGVSLALWDLAVVTHFDHQEAGENELPYQRVRQIAPMSEAVAHAVIEHAEGLERLRERIQARNLDEEQIIQELTRALAGYGDDVGSPVLEAAKNLDLSREEA